ncbi:CLUMA_CG006491, isoform A [Clunio marinus]|uniref:CLUMA_CG006491, isoform A n=1 Tax=Clunio marinus TaxID=568069 RepID=A0A1J1I0J5_9DIPT|nr:CLUMA_CG006491, isoform A [Clunio marinus]
MVSSSQEITGKCFVCDKVSKSRCSSCVQVFYCSVEHQKKDWKSHKAICTPMRVCNNDKIGRHYVATRDIKPGEIVLRESPLIVGPSQSTAPVCVGCLKELDQTRYMECERCGWPICSQNCQNNANHVNNECKMTVERGSKVSIKNFMTPHPTYSCLLPLRCMMLKESNPEKWEQLLELQSNHANKTGSDEEKFIEEGVANFITRFFKCNKWSTDEISKVNEIAKINGHELPLTCPPCVVIYYRASFFEHSCKPNLAKSFSDKNEIIFWAPNAIKAHTNLTISYTDVLWETSNRRHHLKLTKQFDCDCERCSDVTEFGTYFSSLKCQKCPEGMLTPASLGDWNNDWRCTNCSNKMSIDSVNKFINHAGQDLSAMEKENEDNCIKFIEHYSKWLSPNHFYITDVKIALAQIIGSGFNGIQQVTIERLLLKAKICKELIDLIEKIVPNEARILGLIKFELHTAYAEIGRRALQNKDANCKSMLEESLSYCQEAIKLLSNEPNSLPEGGICKQARINASSLLTLLGGMLEAGL